MAEEKSYFKEETNKQYIPPDYTKTESVEDVIDSDDDDDDIDEDISDEDEGVIDSILEEKIEQEKKEEEKNNFRNNTSSFMSQPWGTSQPSSSSPWGNSGWGSAPKVNNNPWERPQPFGSTSPNSGSIWNQPTFGNSNNSQRTEINRNKKVIFCDFLDCIVETYQSNKNPGFIPRDIYDMVPRFDVWERLKAFNPNRVYAMIPKNLMPSTNGTEAWEIALSYFCCSLSSYIRVPYQNCQILAQSVIGQPKEDIILSVIDNVKSPINRKNVVCIGIYSGFNGQSNVDINAAKACNIDYIDLNNLLNNMY